MLFRLKVKLKSDDYPKGTCAASRCTHRSVVVVATRKDWPDDVPLCDRHWEDYCDTDTQDTTPENPPEKCSLEHSRPSGG